MRVLYLAPARLVQNVATEFRDKLDLDARLWIAGSFSDARLETDRVVVASIHKAVFGENARRIVEAGPWDLLVVDECHHLSDWGIDGGKPTQSFRLVDQISQSLPPDGRLILMSGTPHQGSEARFKNILRLLADEKHDIQSARGRVIFRSKDMVSDWKGRPLFPIRQIRPPTVVQLGPDYNRWYNSVGDLCDASIVLGARGRAGGWAKGQALQWAASSVQAGLGFLVRLAIRRLNWDLTSPALSSAIAALRPYRGGAVNEPLESLYLRLRKQIGHLKEDESLADEEDPAEDDWIPNSTALQELLNNGVQLLRTPAANEKWDAVASIIDKSEGEKIVLFAQPVETIAVVADFLLRRYGERPDHQVGDTGLILDRDEHDTLGAAGPLPHQDETRRLEPTPIPRCHRLRAGDDATSREIGTQEFEGVPAQRQPHVAIVLDDLAPGRHGAQCHLRFVSFGDRPRLAFGRGGEQCQRLIPQRLDSP
jgi:hypothetical protein